MPKKAKRPPSKMLKAAKIKPEKLSTRRIKQPKYQSFRPSKRIKHPAGPLPGAPRFFWRSLKHLKKNWKIFCLVGLVYLVLTIVLVKGFGNTANLNQVKQNLQQLARGNGGQLTTGFTLFGVLLGSVGSASSAAAGVYQSILLIIISLVFIWTIRQTFAGSKVRLRDTFYKSTYPLIPFILVLIVIGIQLLPLIVGNALYSLVTGNGLAVTLVEKIVWALAFFLLALLSLYMVTSSLFALYIVTLPDVTPMQALRSARELVRYRRWTIMRKVIFLPIILLMIGAVLTIPLVLFLTPAAEWVFFALSLLSLAVIHCYMYTVYRALL